jgi:hypothetical protein
MQSLEYRNPGIRKQNGIRRRLRYTVHSDLYLARKRLLERENNSAVESSFIPHRVYLREVLSVMLNNDRESYACSGSLPLKTPIGRKQGVSTGLIVKHS